MPVAGKNILFGEAIKYLFNPSDQNASGRAADIRMSLGLGAYYLLIGVGFVGIQAGLRYVDRSLPERPILAAKQTYGCDRN